MQNNKKMLGLVFILTLLIFFIVGVVLKKSNFFLKRQVNNEIKTIENDLGKNNEGSNDGLDDLESTPSGSNIDNGGASIESDVKELDEIDLSSQSNNYDDKLLNIQ